MLCEKCKKRDANVMITEVINGEKKQHNYCSQCASELEIGPFAHDYLPLKQILSGIFEWGNEKRKEDNQRTKENRRQEKREFSCPTCHTSYNEVVNKKIFGCPDCYETFGILMEDEIEKIQGKKVHIGKHPMDYHSHKENEKMETIEESTEEKLLLLQSRLQEAILEEDYQMAAKYRDEITQLKEEMKSNE